MTAFVVFNPHSWGGRTGRDRRKIEEALEKIFPLMSFFVSTAPAQAAHVVRDALRDGHLEILAVGDDGIINEALNGFFDRGAPVSPDAVFSFVHSGHESRLCRRFGIPPGWRAGVAHLAKAKVHKQDVGRVACLSRNGEPVTRFFLGESSFGLSAATARTLGRARLARLFGPGFAGRLHRLLARLRWRETRVRLMTGSTDEIAGIASVSLNVGLPPAGGLFDVSVLDGTNRAENARTLRSARLTAAPTLDTKGLVDVETDGESAGVLPASFEIYPVAINLRV
ncbi:MAG TPA: diacylglycerol kinase family protein [Rhizomicrobium sp.]|nr:diacylglycerol kinase family protein [Rhizomicrobium sp.]